MSTPDYLKDDYNALIETQKKFETLFSTDKYQSANQLPFNISIFKRDEYEKGRYMLTSDSASVRGATGYSSYKRSYCDTSLATILEIGSEQGQSIHMSISERFFYNNPNKYLQSLYWRINRGFSPQNAEHFIFTNIEPDNDEKTASNYPCHCPDFDCYNDDIKLEDILAGLNCTTLFELCREIAKPDTPHMIDIEHIVNNENNNLLDSIYVDFAFMMGKLSKAMTAYIDRYEEKLALPTHT
jgi:hypothetical protein